MGQRDVVNHKDPVDQVSVKARDFAELGVCRPLCISRRRVVLQVPNPEEPVKGTEQRDAVEFKGPVDSVYLKAKDYVELDVGTGAAIAISSSGWEDVVVVRLQLPCMLTGLTIAQLVGQPMLAEEEWHDKDLCRCEQFMQRYGMLWET